ncbi:MAG: ATP-dependent DNA helicase RecG [Candidatus Falkowbacteria bacterium]
MLSLNAKLQNLNRVGESTAASLKKLGLESISDLLFYLPFRYENYDAMASIDTAEIDTPVNIIGQIELIQSRRTMNRRMSLTEALVRDDSGTIKVLWFNQPYLAKSLKVGDYLSLAGKITEKNGQATMLAPIYEKLNNGELIHTQGLTPIYSLNADVTQKQIRGLIKQVVDLSSELEDWIPSDIAKEVGLISLGSAIKKIHFPENAEDIKLAKQHFGFAELFLRQLKSQISRREIQLSQAPEVFFNEEATKNFIASLPFTITNDQKKSAWEIIKDIAKFHPMSRLLQGDVGSGKTLVAVIALLNTALDKKLGVLMAPTEILATQHYNSIKKLLADFPVEIKLLTRNNKSDLSKIRDEQAGILIGTHAIIQDKAAIPNPALIVVDEQHRFGVRQRQKLKIKSSLMPHFLSMTATPIPRSLSLAIYGDLDISVIKEKPSNRQNIITKIVNEENRTAAYKFIGEQIKLGRQAFIVCPLIDPSDKLGVKSVTQEYDKLSTEIFPGIKMAVLHGKMKADEKDAIMAGFLKNEIKILVATSVIEVGVDFPNATIMLIEGVERFGLAQLHQFRGRVGRGEHQSYCFLAPNNGSKLSEKSRTRLEAMVKHQDGFYLAEEDLKLRGAGEIYGTIQSGFPELKIASLFDYELIKKTKAAAEKLIAADPELKNHPLVKKELGAWEKTIHLE